MPQLSQLEIQIQTTANTSGITSASTALAGLSEEASVASIKTGASLSSIGDTLTSLGSKMTSTGYAMTFGLTIPLAKGMETTSMAFMNFHQQMELLSTQAGATQQEVDTLSASVLKLAGTVGQNPVDLAKALYPIESAGYRGAAALDLLTSSAKLADVGQSDMVSTTNALVSVMQSGVKGVNSTSEAIGQMNAIVGAGRMHMEDLNGAISTGLLSAAGTFNMDLKSIGAALAFMTNQGIPATDAATKLGMSIALIAAPSGAAQKALVAAGISAKDAGTATEAMNAALKKAGVHQNELAADLAKPDGLAVVMQVLHDKFKAAGIAGDTAGAIISRAFGGGRSGKAIEDMFKNTDLLTGSYKTLTATTNDFASAVDKQNKEPLQQYKDSLANIQVSLITLGKTILPSLTQVMDEAVVVIKELTTWWTSLNPQTQDFIVKAGMLLAVLGPVLIILGSITTALGTLFSVTGTVIGAVGGLHAVLAALPAAIVIGVAIAGYAAIKAQLDGLKQEMDDINGIKNQINAQDNQIQQMIAAAKKAGDTAKVKSLEKAYQLQAPAGPALSPLNQFLLGIPHFAAGTPNFSGGMALVGERGPEVVNLPHGSQVIPNHQIGGGGNVTVNIQGDLVVDSEERKNQLIQEISYLMGRQSKQAANGMI